MVSSNNVQPRLLLSRRLAQHLLALVILFNIPLSLAPFPRFIVVVLDTISISIVGSNETILTIVVIVLWS